VDADHDFVLHRHPWHTDQIRAQPTNRNLHVTPLAGCGSKGIKRAGEGAALSVVRVDLLPVASSKELEEVKVPDEVV